MVPPWVDAGVARSSDHPVLRGLTPAQRVAVTAPPGPVCLVAGAGSGKTRVITRRVAFRVLAGDADARHTVVVTFTRRAAGELRRRLWRLDVEGVTVGTFHGLALAELRRHWADTRRTPPAVVADPSSLLARLGGAAFRMPAVARSVGPGGDPVRVLAAEIDWARARDLGPESYPEAARAAGRRPAVDVDDVAALLERYVVEKHRRHVVDLHDLVSGAARLLESDPALAEAVRWRMRHLLVDEFQDVNPAQWRLLRALLGSATDLFVVGDPQQAIYSWNGADPGLIDRLPDLLPGMAVLRLDDNHRCSPQVVAAAAAVLALDLSPAANSPTADRAPAGDHHRAASTRPDGPLPEVRTFDDDASEAAAVVRWLRLVHQPGARWANLAVLARTHARLAPVAAALRRAGIPHRYSGRAPGPTSEADALLRPDALLRLAAGPPQPAGLQPTDDAGAGDDTSGQAFGPSDTVAGLRTGGEADASEGEPATRSSTGADSSTGDDGVELATFHRAKGLEWDGVAVVGLEDGLVPIAYARGADAQAEERRLLYVAVTRASRHLWCSYAVRRSGSTRTASPSPWLAAIERAAIAAPVVPAPLAKLHVSLLRQQLHDGR